MSRVRVRGKKLVFLLCFLFLLGFEPPSPILFQFLDLLTHFVCVIKFVTELLKGVLVLFHFLL